MGSSTEFGVCVERFEALERMHRVLSRFRTDVRGLLENAERAIRKVQEKLATRPEHCEGEVRRLHANVRQLEQVVHDRQPSSRNIEHRPESADVSALLSDARAALRAAEEARREVVAAEREFQDAVNHYHRVAKPFRELLHNSGLKGLTRLEGLLGELRDYVRRTFEKDVLLYVRREE